MTLTKKVKSFVENSTESGTLELPRSEDSLKAIGEVLPDIRKQFEKYNCGSVSFRKIVTVDSVVELTIKLV